MHEQGLVFTTGATGDGFGAGGGVVVVDDVIRRPGGQHTGKGDTTGRYTLQHRLNQHLVVRVAVWIGGNDLGDGTGQGVGIMPVNIEDTGVGTGVGNPEAIL